MSPPKIPEPTRAAAENIKQLDRALKLFANALQRREEAQQRANAAKFKLGDVQRNAPRAAFSDVKTEAQHAQAEKDAQAGVAEATEAFLRLDGEVAQAAVAVNELNRAVDHALRLELEPVRRAGMKQVESAVDALLAATDAVCAINRVIGNGAAQVYPTVPCPTTGTDLAYNRPRAAPAVAPDWFKYQQLRSAAMDVDRELPPSQAAE